MRLIPITLCVFVCLLGCKPVTENPVVQPELLTKQDSIRNRATPNIGAPNPSVIRVYDKLNFGNGYNSTTNQEYFGVLDFEGTEISTELAANARGNRGYVTMEILESKKQLKTALNISAKADLNFKAGLWSSSNTLKMSTMRDTEFTSFSQHAIIKASYANEPLVLINPQVKKELIALAKKDPETFMRTCGDMFVSRIYTGGELYTLYSLNSRDTNEKQKNDLFFKSVNEYLGNTLDVEVAATAMNQSSDSVKNINTTVITEGGGKTPVDSDMASFLEYASAFKEQVSADQRAVILYVELSPYENIAGFPKIDFSKIRVKQRGVLEAASNILYMIEEDKDNADFVQEHPEVFAITDVLRSFIVKKRYDNHIELLRKIISDCKADPDYCAMSDLDMFNDYKTFNPHFDLPEWEGEPTKLPLKASEGWVEVCENTEKGKLLSIQGDLEIRTSTKDDPICRDGSYGSDRRYYGEQYTKTTGALWWKKDHYRPIESLDYYPHYKVRYISRETGNVVKTFNWTGPVETEKDVRVEMAFVNPVSRLQYYNGKKYKDIGTAAEEKLGYKTRAPLYPVVQSCDAALPATAIISPKDAPPKKEEAPKTLMASNDADLEVAAPPIKKGESSVYAFKYNWDNED